MDTNTNTNSVLPLVERVPPGIKPQEISLPLPKSLHTTAHIHLTFLGGNRHDHGDKPSSVMTFLTVTTPGDSESSTGNVTRPMGSFVYAMPDRTKPPNTISTTLYSSASNVEYATRTAKILARRMGVPVYVGCSMDSNSLGLTVEEEMEGLRRIVGVIMEKWEETR